MIKKILLTFLLAFICFIGIDSVYAAEYKVSYSSGIQWVYTGVVESSNYSGTDYGGAINGGEKSFGQTYTISKPDLPVSTGPAFYYGPRMLLIRLSGMSVKANTYYRIVIRLIHDNAMSVYQSNINENNGCSVLSNGSWANLCPSNTVSISDPHEINIYLQTIGSGDALSFQIASPFQTARDKVWASFQNRLENVDMTFGVSSVEVYETDDSSAQLNDLIIKSNETNSLLNDTNDKLDQSNKKLDDVNESIKDTNKTLNDDDVSESSSEAQEFFEGFTTDTHGLTSIITAPLELIGNIAGSTCSPLPLEIPFVGGTFNLPCMSSIYKQYFGSFLTIYQTITFGIVAYWVCVRIFALVKDFKNPDHDEIEVMDL